MKTLKKRKRIKIAVVGPSGAGKGKTVDGILKTFPYMRFIVSYTTRPMSTRKNGQPEVDGIDYHFISEESFLQLKDQDFFMESDFHYDAWYGTPKDQCVSDTHNLLFDVDTHGAEALKRLFPDLVTIFAMPENEDSLLRRLRERGGESEEKIQKRVRRFREEEFFYAEKCTYCFVNSDGRFNDYFARVAFAIFKEQGGFLVALDSLSGAGGGTAAGNLANYYQGRHIDSGVFYRILAWLLGIGRGISPDGERIAEILEHNHKVFDINAFNIHSDVFRSSAVDDIVHLWSQNKTVRDQAFWLLMKAAYGYDDVFVVCEGRDMSSRVFPDAQLCVYLHCDLEIRAPRRKKDPKYEHLSIEAILKNLFERDYADKTRAESPFIADQLPNNVHINNHIPPELVLNALVNHVEALQGGLLVSNTV